MTAITQPLASERELVRDLARRYRDLALDPEQDRRRALWRRQNSLKSLRPLIYVRAFAWQEMPESRCVCADPFWRHYEQHFRHGLFWHALGDDSIFEPWVTVQAVRLAPPDGVWGLPVRWGERVAERGSRVWEPPIREPEDARKLVVPRHEVDEGRTAEAAARVRDALGDILPVSVDRAPVYRMWNADISTCLAHLRGIEPLMLDMLDRPEWLHGVLAFMRDGILKAHEEAERAGDWRLADHQNQAMPYAEELDDPAADSPPVPRSKLWTFCASQETTLVGPAMFEEFMLRYQIPLMAPFGLSAYGCCEDLTQKIDVLRRVPNLRRIAVSPMADVRRCAEQIGRDYVISYRPSPSDMVGYGFDPERIRRLMRRDLGACRGLHVDITLKDVETVQNDPTRVREWVRITRELIDEMF